MTYLATFLLFLGVYYINKLKIRGHIFGAISNSIWLVVAYNLNQPALIIQSIVLIMMAGYGILNWSRKGAEL